MKRFFVSLGGGILSTLIGGTIFTAIFYPDVFAKGISNTNWTLYIKFLLGFGIFVTWIYLTVYYKTRDLFEHNKQISQDILALRSAIDAKSGDHFYTTDEKERLKAIQRYRYNDENIACYVYSEEKGRNIEGAIPLYRLYRSI